MLTRMAAFWPPSRRVVLALAGIAAVATIGTVIAIRRAPDAALPTATTTEVVVSRRDVRATVSAIGNVEYGVSADLSFSQNGVLRELLFDIGDIVAEGSVIARLDPTELARSLEDARSAVRQSEIQLQQLLAGSSPDDVQFAELNLLDAQAALD